MAKITGKYEVLYIINPTLGEESIAALVEKFKAMVEAEGTLANIDEWGKRRLAYEINDLTEGYYVLMNFESKPESGDQPRFPVVHADPHVLCSGRVSDLRDHRRLFLGRDRIPDQRPGRQLCLYLSLF